MQIAHRWRDRNLTRIELVMAVLVLALLIGSFSRYTLSIYVQAERNMIDRTIMNINTALKYRASIAVMKNEYDELQKILHMNPMDLMQSKIEVNNINDVSSALAESSLIPPSNYGGVIYIDSPELIEAGKWYYHYQDKVLIYKVRNDELFTSSGPMPASIRFNVNLIYIDNNNNEQFDQSIDDYKAVKLESLGQYSWGIEEEKVFN